MELLKEFDMLQFEKGKELAEYKVTENKDSILRRKWKPMTDHSGRSSKQGLKGVH